MGLGDLKVKLISLQSPLWRAWAKLCRAEVAGDVCLIGRPHFRIARGARVVLSQGVKLFGTKAMNPLIGSGRSTFWAIAPGALIELGKDVGGSSPCICAAERIRIGEGTILGADCLIVDNDFHLPGEGWQWGFNPVETAKPVEIGRGCFIGARSIILKGVTIGDGSVIGAGAVVTSDVPAFHMATGNPAVVRPLSAKWRRDAGFSPAL